MFCRTMITPALIGILIFTIIFLYSSITPALTGILMVMNNFSLHLTDGIVVVAVRRAVLGVCATEQRLEQRLHAVSFPAVRRS